MKPHETTFPCPYCGELITLTTTTTVEPIPPSPTLVPGSLDFSNPDLSGLLTLFEDT